MDRRSFIKSTSASLGALAVLGAGCAGDQPDGEGMDTAEADSAGMAAPRGQTLGRIGVQLYTVRSIMQDDLAGKLQQIADIGYKEVEFAGYGDHTPEEVRQMLDAAALTAPAAHVAIDLLRSDLDSVLQAGQTIGHQYIVCPWLAPPERTLDAYRQHVDLFNEVGQRCKDAGLQFAYHNHEFEFETVDGEIPYDMLLQNTDPELVKMELDLYWITVGGKDPLAYFQQYPGRFPLCHIKDRTSEGEMVPVGQGAIDFAIIFAHSDEAGLKHYFVEHDNPSDPMASIRASYEHLANLQFEG